MPDYYDSAMKLREVPHAATMTTAAPFFHQNKLSVIEDSEHSESCVNILSRNVGVVEQQNSDEQIKRTL